MEKFSLFAFHPASALTTAQVYLRVNICDMECFALSAQEVYLRSQLEYVANYLRYIKLYYKIYFLNQTALIASFI